jgi:hypothetical protein
MLLTSNQAAHSDPPHLRQCQIQCQIRGRRGIQGDAISCSISKLLIRLKLPPVRIPLSPPSNSLRAFYCQIYSQSCLPELRWPSAHRTADRRDVCLDRAFRPRCVYPQHRLDAVTVLRRSHSGFLPVIRFQLTEECRAVYGRR